MSESSLVDYTHIIDGTWSAPGFQYPHWSSRGGKKIDAIVIHHAAGVVDVERLGQIMANKDASATYGIGYDGKIAQYVSEAYRPWTTSTNVIDSHAVTIEVSNSQAGGNWPVYNHVLDRLIDLVADICWRNGIEKCTYTGGKDGVLQMHRWYHSTACPGPYLASKFPYIADKVNEKLEAWKKPAKDVPTDGKMFYVQTGAFKSKANAEKMVSDLKAKGITAIIKEQ